MKILIGAPVYRREWILPQWFEAIENQTVPLRDVGFIFETSPDDVLTKELLIEWHWKHPEVWQFDFQDNSQVSHEAHDSSGKRRWNRDRYRDMAYMRNRLLGMARVLGPDRYFSLDTDLLLEDPETIERLVRITDGEADAAAPLAYMSPMTKLHPNVMEWMHKPGGRATRKRNFPIGQVFRADVIMAAKMMSRPVYEKVNYGFHRQGEDLSWSANCFLNGYNLYSVSDLYVPHIMSESMLRNYMRDGDHRGYSRETAKEFT